MPLPPKNLTRETRLYLALWRKAQTTKQPITLTASSLAMALHIRTGLYRAIRPYRYGEAFDTELAQAAEHFVVAVPQSAINGKFTIEIRPRMSLSELEAELKALGLTDDDFLLPEEKRLADDIAVPEKLVGKRQTPFYGRED